MASLKFPIGTKVMCKSQGWYKGVYEVLAYDTQIRVRVDMLKAAGKSTKDAYGDNTARVYWLKPAGDQSTYIQRDPGTSQGFQASQLVLHVILPTERTPESVLAWLMSDE